MRFATIVCSSFSRGLVVVVFVFAALLPTASHANPGVPPRKEEAERSQPPEDEPDADEEEGDPKYSVGSDDD